MFTQPPCKRHVNMKKSLTSHRRRQRGGFRHIVDANGTDNMMQLVSCRNVRVVGVREAPREHKPHSLGALGQGGRDGKGDGKGEGERGEGREDCCLCVVALILLPLLLLFLCCCSLCDVCPSRRALQTVCFYF